MTEASADTSGAGGDVLDTPAPVDEFKLREVQVREGGGRERDSERGRGREERGRGEREEEGVRHEM